MIPDILGWERALPYLLGAFAAGFAVGAIPFGLLITRVFGLGDLRKVGSGNIGATNVLRTGHRGAALLTLVADTAKGTVPALIAWAMLGPLASAAAGIGAFLGHCFSPFLGFRGGKGVASGSGVLFAWRWEAMVLAAVAWLAIAFLTKRSSLGAFAAAAAGLGALALFEEWTFFWGFLLMSLVMLFQHRSNIARLLRGEEPKISLGRKRKDGGA
ncbi:MAG: glycerol-3-phosphate 1-O-acyltransferase PlsY [Pseudomonadota bacterium]